jgi:16S rRNA (cytidine1402-2'-O)-methyltransferase
MGEALGNRPAAIARELTKIHEEILRGDLAHLRKTMAERPAIKGEITLLVGGAGSSPQPDPESAGPAQLAVAYAQLVKTGLSRMDAIKAIARRHSLPKRAVYDAIQAK